MKCLNNAKQQEKEAMEKTEKFDGKVVRKS
jgi:hypothetical protein